MLVVIHLETFRWWSKPTEFLQIAGLQESTERCIEKCRHPFRETLKGQDLRVNFEEFLMIASRKRLDYDEIKDWIFDPVGHKKRREAREADDASG